MKPLALAAAACLLVLTACSSPEPAPPLATKPVELSAEELARQAAVEKLEELQETADATATTVEEKRLAVQEGIDAYIAEEVTQSEYYASGLPHLHEGCSVLDSYGANSLRELKTFSWPAEVEAAVETKREELKALRWAVKDCTATKDFESAYRAFSQAPVGVSPVYSYEELIETLEAL